MEASLLATTARVPGTAPDRPSPPPTPGAGGASFGRPTARLSLAAAVAAGVLFVVALVPRLLDLDRHATADEDLTLIRSANVALALERADWWATYQIGHPEATVQLLVALGLGPDALRPYAGDFLGADARQAARTPGYLETLASARRLMAPVHAVLVVLAALLAWLLWGGAVGLLVGLLLSLEPFLVAHGRILRTDALLAELVLVAVLAALAFWSGRAGRWSLGLAAAATGLAFLTKTPALALLGAVPLAALAATHERWRAATVAWRAGGSVGAPPARALALIRAGGWLTLWFGGSVGLAFALWPALWARPLRALERMAVYTQEKGGSPMDAGSYFLGTPIPDPGPLYYLVALPLRLSPLVLAGLLLWLILRGPGFRRGVGPLLLIGLGLAAALAVLPKKADRYILPAMPFLVVVAAVGLAALAARWRIGPTALTLTTLAPGPRFSARQPGGEAPLRRTSTLALAALLAIVAATEVSLLALVWPYPLAAYSPLLGGGPTAARLISVGWGEGLDQLAPAVNALPDASRLTVSAPYPEVLQAQVAARVVDLDAYDVADYAVTYVAASQRHLTAPALEEAIAERAPLHRVEIAGIPYAELYALDRPAFEGGIQVRQLGASPAIVARRGWVTVHLALDPSVEVPAGTSYEVEVVLLDAGKLVDVDASIVRTLPADGTLQEVKLRAPSQGGRYAVGVRLSDPRDGRFLPIAVWPLGAPREADRLVFPSLGVRVQ